MLFNSLTYAVFLPAVLVLYWTVARRRQNALLLLASYVFYAAWDWRFLFLIWLSTVVDYTVGLRLERTSDDATRRRLLLTSIAVNLGVLGFFKYFGFFVDGFAALADGVGLQISAPVLDIALPVGISFYTFQTMAYTIDVYRRRLAPERSLLVFGLYVAFFPQLVAGPIERAERLLPQLRDRSRSLDLDRIGSAVRLIVVGLLRKVVIADAMAPVVRDAFSEAATAGWVTLVVGVLAFTLQIYGDFAGYSAMARGSARLLGVELVRNFDQPYLARDIADFWRRWHMSLSQWLRDYLYISVGGNRRGVAKTYRNLMLTMLLGGLWHGAGWTFVAWGGLHGLYLVVHRQWRRLPRRSSTWVPGRVAAWSMTFVAVAVAWIFFRAETFPQAFDVLRGIAGLREGTVAVTAIDTVLIGAALSFGLDLVERSARRAGRLVLAPAARGLGYASAVLLIVVFAGGDTVPFIYFQF